jgi:hypothetical protein
MTITDRFVVGTGRCGSTLLTRMLATHRDVLPLNEFFTGLDWGRRFPDQPVTGDEVADLIATPNDVLTQVLARGYDAEEIQYRFRDTDRYRRDEPVPWVLVATLSRLHDDADVAFDEAMDFLRKRPAAPVAAQYRALFDWWATSVGRPVWIERSGSSIDYLGDLADLFPQARFVHLHRDGREAALSIRAHPFYRLAVSLLYDQVPETTADEDVITALLEAHLPVELFGRYWTEQLLHGFAALPRLDHSQYLDVRFEDLVERPAEIVAELADFFELAPDDGFADRAAALVRGAPPTRFASLAHDEQCALVEACRPGQVLLGRDPSPPAR